MRLRITSGTATSRRSLAPRLARAAASTTLRAWSLSALFVLPGCSTSGPADSSSAAGATSTAEDLKVPNDTMATLATDVSTTSNVTGGVASLTDVRPGDTVDYDATINLANGSNGSVVLSDTFPTNQTYVSHGTVTVSGTVLCNGGVCTAPVVATAGSTTSFTFGTVTCTTAAGCTIHTTIHAQVGVLAARGDSEVNTVGLSGVASQMQTLTVDEPNLTMSQTATPASGVTRGQTTTVVVTLANDTGGANSPAFAVSAVFATPANTTVQNYRAGTCPTATASAAGGNETFTFPTGAAGGLASGSSCTFSYDLLLGAAAPLGQMITVAGGTAHSQSTPVAPDKTYTFAAADTGVTTSLLPVGAACGAATDCADATCQNGICGLAIGNGPCTPGADPNCQSDSCSTASVCKAAAACAGDPDCAVTQFCNTATDTCEAKLANGTAIPTIAGHTPTLTGLCNSPDVGTQICASGVCDPVDNKCGLELGDGTCNSMNAVAQCRAGACIASGTNGGTCQPCGADSDCRGATPACDVTTNQCVTCSATNVSACSGRAAACNTTNSTCTGCNGDFGSGATFACPTTAPFCNTDPTTGGSCSNTCTSDAECGAGNWCNAGACTGKLANGTAIPTVTGHSPAITGTCTPAVAAAICVTGACDTSDNECGVKLGDGTCTTTAECRSGLCVTSGTNGGKCEVCIDDTTCGGATPACDTMTNSCAACDATHTDGCTGATPICNTASFVCTGCNGDNGSGATFACPTATPNCDKATGQCGALCLADADCGEGNWCDDGTCLVKLANGVAIPTVSGHTPALTGACSAAVATAVCVANVCDPKTNTCGIAAGDGTCTSSAQCTVSLCNVATGVCTASTPSTDGGAPTVVVAGPAAGVEVRGDGCAIEGSNGGGSANANGLLEFGGLFAVVGLFRQRKKRRAASSSFRRTF